MFAGTGTVRFVDVYPRYGSAGVDSTAESTTIAASGPNIPNPPQSPAMALLAILALLVVLRVVYEAAPESGKGI